MKQYLVKREGKSIKGEIILDGSKSLSNRALIIQALCKDPFEIQNCSKSDDSTTLKNLLSQSEETYDAHHAGTTFRFLCSYLCLKPGNQILTGSERMKQRPIGPLVDALRSLGATIEYLGQEGYPPLKIGALDTAKYQSKISVSAGISSQFISSILHIAPVLPHGLEINLDGDLVSRPYLEMTLKMMEYFGITHHWVGQTITIPHQPYKARPIHIEADWSAASYYYIIAAFAQNAEITLHGLHEDSLQGDRKIADIMEAFGLTTTFIENAITIRKDGPKKQIVDHDFINEPDIAQSVAVACAGCGKPGVFSGLKTLLIKETDRIAALQNELAKVHVYFSKMPKKFASKSNKDYYMIEGKAKEGEETPDFDTYKDHRMAMAFAPLGMLFPVIINEPDVVSKSYPDFWDDLSKLDFEIETVNSHLKW